jgi:energy-coupling factor transport system ATP-binding protein
VIASLSGVTYTYPGATTPALRDVSLEIPKGAFVLVAGPSAGGKSTLLRLFNGLVPQFHGGRLTGSLDVGGLDPSRTPARRMALIAGMVFQEPEAQAVTDTVEDEVAFGMEQHGVAPAEMASRMDRLLAELGIEHLRFRRLSTLSGGERQRVAIAAVLALEPRMLVLDEPTSQLDPAGAEAVIAALQRLNRDRGLTVAVAEHRLERLLPVADLVVEVRDGNVAVMTPREAASRLAFVPAVTALGARLGLDPLPLTVAEARPLLPLDLRPTPAAAAPQPGVELLAATGVTVAYGEKLALREATLSLRAGEIVALVGPNGSGKTTLFRALAGLVKPAFGTVTTNGAPAPDSVQQRTAFAGLVPQDPAIALYHESVRDEVLETIRNRSTIQNPKSKIQNLLDSWGVSHLASANPRDISVGQQQRVAIAAMLVHEPPVWLLDEPTRGADGASKAWLAARLREHARGGGAAIVATHDIESAARFATRVIALKDGLIGFDLPAYEAFGHDGPMPTQVAQLVPGALTPGEVSRR